MFSPVIHEWSYERGGQKRKGAAFRGLLVSLSNPSHYVKGEILMRNDKKEPLEQAKKKFTENKSFRMSAVHFQSNTAQEFVHTPLKFVVDLSSTRLDPLLSRAEGQIIQAQPCLTLSEINELQQSQRFDVIALVEQVGDPVPTQKAGRVRRQIQIIDQSAPDSKVQETKFSFFCDTEPSQKDLATVNILQQVAGTTEPLTFFGLSGKKSTKDLLLTTPRTSSS